MFSSLTRFKTGATFLATCLGGSILFHHHMSQSIQSIKAEEQSTVVILNETQSEHVVDPYGFEANSDLPIVPAELGFAPNVPPPINRNYPVRLRVDMDTTIEVKNLSNRHKYAFWTFNRTVPGPFIRARVGDVMEINYTNKDETG